MKRLFAALFALLLVGAAFAASISDLCPDKKGLPDNACILENAKTATDCDSMNDMVMMGECYERTFPNTEDCSKIATETGRKDCAIYKLYAKSSSNMGACDGLQSAYVKDCYIYFVYRNSPTDLDKCAEIPSGYQVDCQKRLLRGMVGLAPDEKFCNGVKSQYKEACLEVVEERKAMVGLAVGLTGAGLGLAGLFLLWPFICGGIVFIVVVIAIAYYFWQKGKKEQK